ncbi:MAG: O-antigen ligase family protein [Anaerolineales bacterium]|nr:O-antigen ligase family protein [Anaerolineales bacterium]
MPTKLSRYAEGLMEAGWLAALIVAPVFFNIYSSRIFEPDKATLLRTLALVILAAWLIKLFEQGGLRWERLETDEPRWKTLLRIPLVAPVLILALAYLLSTIFSITPGVSLWGSYQRLQGTYTTFSYLVVFASMAVNLRRREQVERLIGVAILASLPVSLYGVLQRFKIDPIPWGGDTASRVASNMGNSIFVAAYLIMVFPLTVLRIVESFEALLTDRGRLGPNFARSTGYVFIAALQLIALYYSGSRGPWLGLAASLVFLWLGLSLIWRTRWLTISGVVLAFAAGAFLVVLNIPGGPLESLRTRDEFKRLGQLLDAESRTGRVRTLVWGGAAELVQSTEPLEFPDGSKDRFSFLRPVIGYGPESMYVAYNRYYPPGLTQVEKRNASPDRSHNETWDALVITGGLGLVAYLFLFGSVLYYGLRWLGLISGAKQRNWFLGLTLSGGVIVAAAFVLWRDIGYLGVALPAGMVLGVALYLVLASLFSWFQPLTTTGEKLRAYVLLGLLAAVVAHWVEINFGIAIVATRAYFWVIASLLLLVGYKLPMSGEYQATAGSPAAVEALVEPTAGEEKPRKGPAERAPAPRRNQKSKAALARKRRHAPRSAERFSPGALPGWLREALIVGLIVAVLLTTLGFDLISNASRQGNASSIIKASLTYLPGEDRNSNGVLALFLTSWLVGVLLLVSESVGNWLDVGQDYLATWWKMLATALGVSILLGLLFWLWHAGALAALTRAPGNSMEAVLDQVVHSEGLLTNYYIYLFLLVFGAGVLLPSAWPPSGARWQPLSTLVALGALVVAFALGSYTNLRVIQADIAFKTAELFSKEGTWPVAIAIYNHANELAPNEDYYYLFLGRAYLEHAKTIQEDAERESLIAQAANDLLIAQEINPLNTDHTANLARLHSLWATYAKEPQRRAELASKSDDYFTRALVLSPNNARLWDEWAILYLNVLNQPEQAYERLLRALELDPYYDWTYGLLGDYLVRYVSNDPQLQPEQKQETLIQASDYYSRALKNSYSASSQLKFNYAVALAGLQAQLGQLEQAAQAYERALKVEPNHADRWRIELVLARLYAQRGDIESALQYARSAQSLAPEEQQQAIADLISQLGGQP